MAWDLSLIIPAFNEEPTIARAIAEAQTALTVVAGRFEILVVDDGSTDATAEIVRGVPSDEVRLYRHSENRGYGAALRTGFEGARFDRIAFTDADCQFDLHDLGLLLELTREADIAAGRRVDRKDPWQRRFYSWSYNRMVRLLLSTGLRDIDCALKVFRRDALACLLPESRGFFVNTEMLSRARRLGLTVVEAGVRHRPRLDGVSKVSLRDIPRTLRQLIPFWWRSLFDRGAGVAGSGPPLQGAVLNQTAAVGSHRLPLPRSPREADEEEHAADR
jgi:dolichol-phosphate mannosyltransferase